MAQKASSSPLCYSVNKKIIFIGKGVLSLFEDLIVRNQAAKESLVETIQKLKITEEEKDLFVSILGQSDPLNFKDSSQIRKRILDLVNEAARELTTEFDNYKIEIKA